MYVNECTFLCSTTKIVMYVIKVKQQYGTVIAYNIDYSQAVVIIIFESRNGRAKY